MAKDHFPKVREAREALRERAVEILEEYLKTIRMAQDAGDYEVATKSLQWLMEHLPADEVGDRMVEASIDKAKPVETKTGPSVRIGIQLGGVNNRKALPSAIVETIDAE